MNATAALSPETLARRLAEAEGTIIALLSGQIDAVVDPASNTPVLLAKAQGALRASEHALRTERDRAQRYLDTAEVILLALDSRGCITMANRFACSMFGQGESELLGRDFIDTCVPERLREETRAKLAEVLHGPDSSVVDNLIVTSSGAERMIEWRNTLQRDSHGVVVSTLSSGADVTDRDRASEALRVAEERTRFMLKAAGIGIWDADYTTGAVEWSETIETHYGLKPGAFGGTFEAFAQLIHPDDRPSVLATIAAAVESGADFSMQHRAVWPDGTVRWLTGAGRVHLGENGDAVRAVGISIDVTDRHLLEEQYQQAQKMEAVGRLAGGVAHDFNNLLLVITGYSEMLLEGMTSTDSRREDLEQIRGAALAAASLTRQLLAFSRQQVIEPKDVVLDSVVATAASMLQRLIGEDVELVTTLGTSTSMVHIDSGQLEQVVMNLVVNARDAMPTGGKLTIETAISELTQEDANAHWPVTPGRYAMMAVSDTGIGMDEATRSKIFEPFFTTKEQGKGTGLGLATVYGIVKQSEGFIWVYSEPGKGSTFKIYLPLVRDPAAVSVGADAGEQDPPRGVETIVVVEDSDRVRDIAQRVLERQGYRVLTAIDAASALRIARSYDDRIGLLLTDIVMPGMSGRVLAETFLTLQPDTKVLYMSGYTDDAVVRHGVLMADTPYLQKPFSPRALAFRVREVLDA